MQLTVVVLAVLCRLHAVCAAGKIVSERIIGSINLVIGQHYHVGIHSCAKDRARKQGGGRRSLGKKKTGRRLNGKETRKNEKGNVKEKETITREICGIEGKNAEKIIAEN